MFKKYLKRVKQRKAEIEMLHIGLNDGWRVMDIFFLLTGKIL